MDRTAVLVLACALVAGLPEGVAMPNAEVNHDAEIRGREVYIAEGCIHCHSQYIRPGTMDQARWGSPRRLPGSPPLLGNRRQGPDLTTAGLRLPADWHREHLMAPRRFKPGSRMPSYA